MLWKRAIITIVISFGVGFGLTSTISSARACQCIWGTTWLLLLEKVEGDADSATEQIFWQEEARIHNFSPDNLRFTFEDDGSRFTLEPLP